MSARSGDWVTTAMNVSVKSTGPSANLCCSWNSTVEESVERVDGEVSHEVKI